MSVLYAVLRNPGHNRIFFEESPRLCLAEAEMALSGRAAGLREEALAGVSYIMFETASPLSPEETARVQRLSFCYALFVLEGVAPPLLRPAERLYAPLYGGEPGRMLKYPGKTNELFTAFLLNAAQSASDFRGEAGINLLDPVAGRATTLFEGLSMGFNAFGVEIDGRAVNEATVFFKKYLEMGRHKHRFSKLKVSGENKAFRAERQTFLLSPKGEERTLELVSGAAENLKSFYRKGFFHLAAGDLAYGVRHGSKTDAGSPSRSPAGLLEACLPGIYETLKKGGAAAFSWNTHQLSRRKMAELFLACGFRVLSGGAFDRLEHRVDQGINRDVIIAKKD